MVTVSGTTVTFYVDGRELGVPVAFADLPTGGGNGFLRVGNGIDQDTGFDGLIDELTIYNEVLLPQEVFVGPPPGDINMDGIVWGDGTGPAETDDVTAFVVGWMTTGHATVLDQIAHGDMNLDGITNINDWGILNSFDPHLGQLILNALVPEPSGFGLAFMAVVLVWRRR